MGVSDGMAMSVKALGSHRAWRAGGPALSRVTLALAALGVPCPSLPG